MEEASSGGSPDKGHDTVIPVMDELRSHIDDLEMIVDDEMWTLPKYRELLFIR